MPAPSPRLEHPRHRATSRLLLLAVAGAAGLSCQEPPRSARQVREGEPAQATHPECADAARLAARVGASCRVTGRYQIKRFPGKKVDTVLAEWPVIVMADGTEVMLESLWDPSKAPERGTVTQLAGKLVEATGTVHREPPVQPGHAANSCSGASRRSPSFEQRIDATGPGARGTRAGPRGSRRPLRQQRRDRRSADRARDIRVLWVQDPEGPPARSMMMAGGEAEGERAVGARLSA